MAGLKAIGTVFGGLMLVLMMLVGAGTAYYKQRDHRQARHDIPEASDVEYDRGYRPSGDDEYYRERRREREGVNIDSGSTRPMVDVDPDR